MLGFLYRYALGFLLIGLAPFAAQAAEIRFMPDDRVHAAQIEQQTASISDFAARVAAVSAGFLGTPYIANTLIGGADVPEVLVIRFDGVDCYTFVDLVRALALSGNEKTLISTLAKTRYHDGQITYLERRHFLTDWAEITPQNARDITRSLSSHVEVTPKVLNRRADGSVYIKGLPVRSRNIAHLSPEFLTPAVAAKIHTGDVIGIYTRLEGLDVTHTGLAIWKNGILYFRNASSLKTNMKVVDTPLSAYLAGKPGFLVLRMVEAG